MKYKVITAAILIGVLVSFLYGCEKKKEEPEQNQQIRTESNTIESSDKYAKYFDDFELTEPVFVSITQTIASKDQDGNDINITDYIEYHHMSDGTFASLANSQEIGEQWVFEKGSDIYVKNGEGYLHTVDPNTDIKLLEEIVDKSIYKELFPIKKISYNSYLNSEDFMMPDGTAINCDAVNVNILLEYGDNKEIENDAAVAYINKENKELVAIRLINFPNLLTPFRSGRAEFTQTVTIGFFDTPIPELNIIGEIDYNSMEPYIKASSNVITLDEYKLDSKVRSALAQNLLLHNYEIIDENDLPNIVINDNNLDDDADDLEDNEEEDIEDDYESYEDDEE